ncbi:MAG: NAD(P)/FAD-dependent oxidoreductase [Gammaproteobacteria bacterium]|nr:NAD(P)/FAD-dependent oxidoreductase [Gammaproteobacteria bacterium]
MTETLDAIVVGAGHNGLVCAGCLARAGLNVTVLESAAQCGGMAGPRSLDRDYHIPSLAHTAFPLAEHVRHDLELDRHGYVPGPPAATISLQPDGRHLRLTGHEVSGADLHDADRSAYARFADDYGGFARALTPLMTTRPPRLKDMDFTDKKTLARLGWRIRMGLGKASMYEFLRVVAMNIYDVLDEIIEDERLKGLIAADAVIGHNAGPRSPGTVLTYLMRRFNELGGPMYVVAGNGSQVIDALAAAASGLGVSLQYGSTVEKILVENGRTTGVRLNGGAVLKAPLVVSSADPRTTFLDHVGASQLDAMFTQRVSQIRGAGGIAKLHVALSGAPDFKGLDNEALADRLLIAPSMQYLERAYNHSKYAELSDKPLLEITFPSAHNGALAPAGHHVMSVNIGIAPYELGSGWDAVAQTLPYEIIATIGQYAPNLSLLVVSHEFLTPPRIEQEYRVRGGHWHHGETTIHQSFMMRPLYGAAQYDTPVDGLFLCGAGTHPGGGITGLPGHNAAKRVLELAT